MTVLAKKIAILLQSYGGYLSYFSTREMTRLIGDIEKTIDTYFNEGQPIEKLVQGKCNCRNLRVGRRCRLT